jgi:hypothetical protein
MDAAVCFSITHMYWNLKTWHIKAEVVYPVLFLYTTVVIFNLIAILMRKNLTPIEYYSTILFGLFNSEIADRFTDKYDAYYFFDPWFIELESLWVLLGIYPAAAMIIVNWFPYNGSKYKKLLYLLGWSVFSSFYEWLSLKAGFLHYHHWKLWYSAILYPFLYSTLFLNLRFVKWITQKRRTKPAL